MTSLFISDLDGTLLNDKQVISEESIDILNKLISQGLQFTIATARSYNSSAKLLEKIDFKLPLVFMNGVFIYDPALKKNIKSNFLSPERSRDRRDCCCRTRRTE